MSRPKIRERTPEETRSNYQEYRQIVENIRQTEKMDRTVENSLMRFDALLESTYGRGGNMRAYKATPEDLDRKPNMSSFLLLDPRLIGGQVTLDEAECYKRCFLTEESGSYDRGEGHKKGYDYETRHVLKKLSADELLAEVAEDEVKAPEEPELGFFGTIRNWLSYLIPALRSEEMKKYDRETEVCRAKRCEAFEEITGVKTGLRYNRKLLDAEYAQKYINGEIDPKTYKAEYQEDLPASKKPGKAAEPAFDKNRVRTKMDSALGAVQMLEETCTTDAERRGAEAMRQYLRKGTPESEILVEAFSMDYWLHRGSKGFDESCAAYWRETFSKIGNAGSPEQIEEAAASAAKEVYTEEAAGKRIGPGAETLTRRTEAKKEQNGLGKN